jgi:hypothetical protein
MWLRLVAAPLIRWYSMKYWEKAVVDELRKMFEKLGHCENHQARLKRGKAVAWTNTFPS